jgi:hypothetical protein
LLVESFQGELWHTPPAWFERPLFDPDTTALFAVVRNPYDRIISEYYCPYFGFHAERLKVGDKQDDKENERDNTFHAFVMTYWGGKNVLQKVNVGVMNNKRQRRSLQGSIVHNDTPEALNEWIQHKLGHFSSRTGHLLPQSFYILDQDGKNQIVRHILRYENLHLEFAQLMGLYQLPIVLSPSQRTNEGVEHGSNTRRRITRQDLSADTIALINQVYERDFRLLGYDML